MISTMFLASPSSHRSVHPFSRTSSSPLLRAANSATVLVASPMDSEYPRRNSALWFLNIPPMLACPFFLEPSKFSFVHPISGFCHTTSLVLGKSGSNSEMHTDSLLIDFETLKAATDNFSPENELGRGGFGSVYKGVFSHGQEIAVKRLSDNSGQGDIKFKNEILLLAKLQHRNLVRLLGFCIQGQERILVYEFIKNASLDHFIFDLEKGQLLNWGVQYNMIRGVAKGLLYLHEDYRDLKASNILRRSDDDAEDLLSWVWRIWREDMILSVIDPSLTTGSRNEILKCIHIGLLCVQESAATRPTMATVALMLSSYSFTLPTPSRPAFVLENVIPWNVSSSTQVLQMSFSELSPR
ncbi:hypothetical protein AALP_AA7G038800 [Arabis alpina]|uniref:Protein kinase domain-containing protein n=1 Tax=Arabis alpina TaxID=50452 RepID=A0A087GFS0_ARAAL|nr:hypothetical protein AALP_AA7G038800 [Arabis alpina]